MFIYYNVGVEFCSDVFDWFVFVSFGFVYSVGVYVYVVGDRFGKYEGGDGCCFSFVFDVVFGGCYIGLEVIEFFMLFFVCGCVVYENV